MCPQTDFVRIIQLIVDALSLSVSVFLSWIMKRGRKKKGRGHVQINIRCWTCCSPPLKSISIITLRIWWTSQNSLWWVTLYTWMFNTNLKHPCWLKVVISFKTLLCSTLFLLTPSFWMVGYATRLPIKTPFFHSLQTYLKEILRDIGIYNVKGTHKNTWELKPEYRHYQSEEKSDWPFSPLDSLWLWKTNVPKKFKMLFLEFFFKSNFCSF